MSDHLGKRKTATLYILKNCGLLFVIRAGFEPTTDSLEGCCSIQLSYRTSIFKCGANIEKSY